MGLHVVNDYTDIKVLYDFLLALFFHIKVLNLLDISFSTIKNDEI